MLSKEDLERLYVGERRTDQEIGVMCGVTDAAVRYWRKKYGLRTLTQRERLGLELPSDGEILALYQGGMSLRVLMKKFGVSKPTIRHALLKSDQYKPKEKWEYSIDPSVELTKEQHEIIIGTLLGDACIPYAKGNSHYKVAHSSRQYGYLATLTELMGEWVNPRGITQDKKVVEHKTYYGYVFKTIHHPSFSAYRREWYRDDLRGQVPTEHLKVPPMAVFENLSDRSLAYWFFDDGCYTCGDMNIAYHFPLLDHGAVVEALNGSTGLSWRLVGSGSVRTLKLPRSEYAQFFERVVPYATPDLMYKFPTEFHDKIEGALVFPPNSGKAELLRGYSCDVWKTLDEESQDRWIAKIFDIYRERGFPYPTILTRSEVVRQVQNVKNYDPFLDDGSFKNSQTGQGLCNGHFRTRWQTLVRNKSAYQTFHNDTQFKKVIRTQLKDKNSKRVMPTNMRSALSIYHGNRTPSNFKPSVMKGLVDLYVPLNGKVLDPCAGFGGRLLGAVCSPKNVSYTGIEPSPQTIEGLQALRGQLIVDGGISPTRMTLIQGVAEKMDFEGVYDLVVTSPPYRDLEQYIGGDQSFHYGGDWTARFFEPLIANSHRALVSGGHLVLNVNHDMEAETIALAEKIGFVSCVGHGYPLSKFGKRTKTQEPILVFQKP